MKTLMLEDLPLLVELSSDTTINLIGGKMRQWEGEREPTDLVDGGGGSSWEKGGQRGLQPTFAVDGSPARVRPY